LLAEIRDARQIEIGDIATTRVQFSALRMDTLKTPAHTLVWRWAPVLFVFGIKIIDWQIEFTAGSDLSLEQTRNVAVSSRICNK